MSTRDRLMYLSISIISILTVFDLFINTGEPATMDGVIHITSMTQFAGALLQGQFPVIWLNNFANYGLPVGLFSQQIPLYIGALFVLLTHNPILSANLLTVLGVILANILFYRFLRVYFTELPSFLGTLLFAFAPFRILDVYIRGAIPESFSLFLLPLILLTMHSFFIKRHFRSVFFLIFEFAALILTHPMMMVIYSVFIFPYFIYLLYELYRTEDRGKVMIKKLITRIIFFITSLILGLGMGSYYILPLFLEKKYFYFGASKNLLTNDFMSLSNYLGYKWYYYYKDNIFTRGHVLQFGLPETMLLFVGVIFTFSFLLKKRKNDTHAFLLTVVIVSVIGVFLTLRLSSPIYQIVPFLSDIQFPWRMFTVLMFIPPIILTMLAEKYSHFMWILIFALLVIIAIRIPQLYGKNYTRHSNAYYEANISNLYSVNMNTIWTGKTEDYPPRLAQASIVNGNGRITNEQISGTKRMYQIIGNSPLRIVDYTFYFPGWNVYIDGKQAPIQFQDPAYRGVITFTVPSGQHQVTVIFQDTTVRKIAKLASLMVLALIGVLFVFRKRIIRPFFIYV